MRGSLRRIFFAAGVAILGCIQPGLVLADVLDISSAGLVTTHNRAAAYFASVDTVTTSAAAFSPASSLMEAMIQNAAAQEALDPQLLSAMVSRESRYRFDALSPKGAFGPMQLMPLTAISLGVDRFDPAQNIAGGARYLRQMMDRFGENTALALAAYNAGPGAVERFHGIPPFPETRGYVSALLKDRPIQSRPSFVIFVNP